MEKILDAHKTTDGLLRAVQVWGTITLSFILLIYLLSALHCEDSSVRSEAQVTRVSNLDANGLNGLLDDQKWSDDLYVLAAIAQSPLATAEILDRISRKNDPRLHQKFFGTVTAMGKNSKGLAVMRLVALHPNVSQATLERLAQSKDEYVIMNVLSNPKTPEHILRAFGDIDSYLIDWGIVENPKAPPELLRKRALSKNEYTRAGVAAHHNTPVDLLPLLAHDNAWAVRRSVAFHPGTTHTLLEQLAQDSDQRVRDFAELQLKKRHF